MRVLSVFNAATQQGDLSVNFGPRHPAQSYEFGATAGPITVYLIGLGLVGTPVLSEIGDQSWRGAGLALILVGLLAAGIKDHIAAVVFFSTATAIAALPPKIVFAGFLSQGTWIIFSGLILASAIKELGLGDRLANRLLPTRQPPFVLAALAMGILSLLLAFMVPSTAARVLLLAPIAVAYAERLGYPPESRATLGLVISGAMTTYFCGGGILTAGLPNVAMVSLAQDLLNVRITYQEYLICAFPVLSLCTFILLTAMVTACFGIAADDKSNLTDLSERGAKATNSEHGALALILCTSVLLWSTDSYHGISTAWIGLGAAALILCGPGRKLSLSQCVKIEVWIVFAALLSLGAILEHTKATEQLGHWLIANTPLQPDNDWANLALVTAVGAALSITGTNLAAPVLYTTLAEHMAQATGWPIKTVLLVGIPAWTFVPFLFQVPILLVCVRMFNLSVRIVSLFMFGFTSVAMVTLVPLHFVWLRHLGYFGSGHADTSAQPFSQSQAAANSGPWILADGGVNSELQGLSVSLPRTYSGWLYWRCWDQEQKIILLLGEASTTGSGRIRANGIEYYHIDGFYRSIGVAIEIDPRESNFVMRETDPDRTAEADRTSDDSYEGRITSDLRRIESRPGGCQPELTLTAVDQGQDEAAIDVAVKSRL